MLSRLRCFALLSLLLVQPSSAWAQDGGDEDPPAPTLTPPRLLEAPELTLPEDAEPLPPDSSVELVLTIGADGTVIEARVEAGVRDDVDTLVIEATNSMRFEPARRNGDAITARVRFRYRVTPPTPPATETDPPEGEEAGEGTGEGTGETEGGAEPVPEAPHLETLETEVQEFGVTAVAERPEAGAASRITLQAEELTTVPGTFGEPLRVVAALPGVVRSPFGLGFFFVRGANFQNTGFFVDGFPVPLLYHLGAGPAVISSRYVSQLDFYPGGYPARFGRFSAGVVSLQTAPPPTDRIRGELSVDLFRASALVVVPFDDGRGSISAAFRRSYYELLLPVVADGIELSFTDYQLRADYRVNSRLELSLFVFGSDDRLDQSGSFGGGTASEGVSNSIGYDFQRAIVGMRLRLPHRIRVNLSGMIGRDANSFVNSQPGTDGLRFALQTSYAAVRLETEIPWIDELQTNLGFDVNAQLFDVAASAFVPAGLGEYPRPLFTPQASNIAITLPRALAAFYIDQIIRLETLEISASARFDYLRYGDVSDIYPDPRLVVRWRAVPELTLKAATGLFTQPPNTFQTTRIGGNPNLPPERSWQSSFGSELTFPENVELHTTAYYTQFFDIPRQTNRTRPGPDGTPEREFFVADQEGRAYGLEVLLRRRVERGFYGWLSYTLSRSERRTNQGNWVPFAFDQTHTLNLAASYYIDGWRVGVRFQLASGRPSNTLVGTSYDSDDDGFDASFSSRGERLELFTRLDVRIDREFTIGPIEGTVYLDIQNIYNATNNEGVLYSYDFSQSTNLPGIPILPTIGITGAIQ